MPSHKGVSIVWQVEDELGHSEVFVNHVYAQRAADALAAQSPVVMTGTDENFRVVARLRFPTRGTL